MKVPRVTCSKDVKPGSGHEATGTWLTEGVPFPPVDKPEIRPRSKQVEVHLVIGGEWVLIMDKGPGGYGTLVPREKVDYILVPLEQAEKIAAAAK